MRLVKIASWHIQSGIVSRGGLIKTLCGRWVEPGSPQADDYGTDRSCETCLRIADQQR